MASALTQAFVAICLSLSAVHKWRDRERFRQSIDEFSLLSGLPPLARSALVRLVPLTEGGVAALVTIPWTSRVGTVGAASLALVFVAVVAFDSRPTIAHCGCWGVASVDVPKAAYLARSILLLIAASSAGAITWAASGGSSRSVELTIASFALAAPFALLLLELPQISQVVRVQQLTRSEVT